MTVCTFWSRLDEKYKDRSPSVSRPGRGRTFVTPGVVHDQVAEHQEPAGRPAARRARQRIRRRRRWQPADRHRGRLPAVFLQDRRRRTGRLRLRHRQRAVRADAGEVPVDRAGVRWPDSLAESSQDRRRAVLHHHHRGTPALGGLHPQVLLHAGPPGDEGRRPARRQLQPVGRQAHRRAARRYRRPLRQCGAGQGRCRSGALHQPGRDLPGPGGRPPRRHLRRLHPAADRLPRYPARQGLRLRRAGVQGPEILRRGRRDRGAQGGTPSWSASSTRRSTRFVPTGPTSASRASTSRATSTATDRSPAAVAVSRRLPSAP